MQHLWDSEQFLYVLLDAKGSSCGCIAVNNFAIFVHQELGEIPFDVVTKESTFAWLQKLVQWSSTIAIHINLIKDGILSLKASANKLFYLFITPRLLCSKLIAWECQNLQTLIFVFLIQLMQLCVVWIGQATLWCNIDNQEGFSLVDAKINIISPSILNGEAVDWLRTGLACHGVIWSQRLVVKQTTLSLIDWVGRITGNPCLGRRKTQREKTNAWRKQKGLLQIRKKRLH